MNADITVVRQPGDSGACRHFQASRSKSARLALSEPASL